MENKGVLENFDARAKQFVGDLNEALHDVVAVKLGEVVKDLLLQYGIEGTAVLEWNFYPESDDQGGTDWYPESIEISTDGLNIDLENCLVSRKARWSDEQVYEYSLGEELNDLLNEVSGIVYESGVTRLIINLEGENN